MKHRWPQFSSHQVSYNGWLYLGVSPTRRPMSRRSWAFSYSSWNDGVHAGKKVRLLGVELDAWWRLPKGEAS